MVKSTCIGYFSVTYNWVDILYLTANGLLLVCTLPRVTFIEEDTQKVIAAFSLALTWYKLIDWLRLFEITSFFIKLINETLYRVLTFTLIMVIWLMVFGTAFFFLNIARPDSDESLIVDAWPGQWTFNTFITMFELSLAAFDYSIYQGDYQMIIFILFVLSVFSLHIVFLNMLIAIMSDIYEETTDKRPRSKRQTELDKMSAYVDLIVQDDKDKTFGFLYSPRMYMNLHYGWFKTQKTS